MKAFDVGQSESNDLPADQVAHLGKARPNQVDRQAVSLLHGAAGKARLLHTVEDREGAGVEEGEVAQLAFLIPRQLVGHQLANFLLKEALYAGWQGFESRLNWGDKFLNLVAETLFVLVVLERGLEQVAPLLVTLLALLDTVGTPGDAVAPGAVPQRILLTSTLTAESTDPRIVAEIHLVLLQGSSQGAAQPVHQPVARELLTDVFHSKRLHQAGDCLADNLVLIPVSLLILLAEVSHLQRVSIKIVVIIFDVKLPVCSLRTS